METKRFWAITIWMVAATVAIHASDYTTYLTAEQGFTEVTTTADLQTGNQYCYLITAAENNSLYVGVGKYEAKPGWAGEDTKALRYRSADINPLLDLSNFFTIEKSGNYIGLRNLYHYTSLFQTHDNAGYMYVLTYTEPTMSDWCYLIPTFQNGYWLFENGKYPVSSGNWACGYMGPWNNTVAEDEPIALNRKNTTGDEAGHYRIFRIAKADLVTKRNQLLQAISDTTPLDVTWRITNPSFETGDETGWTLIGKDPNGNDEFKTRDYWMTGRDGTYLMNAYQWWASSLSIKQTVANVPSGNYDLTAVVASWEGRTVTFIGNRATTTGIGINDATGVPVSLNLNIGSDQQLVITAGSATDWWSEGSHADNDTQCFFKLDNVRLICKGAYLSSYAMPLPNNTTSVLIPGQWYYYDVNYHTEYVLTGELDGFVYSTNEDKILSEITTTPADRNITLNIGRVFFKTTRSDATLAISPSSTMQEGTFTAVALNVDGLPKEINYGVGKYDLNPDGPGAEGTRKISQYLASKNYDFIGCSEDFNYNGSLMESLNNNYWCGTIRKTLSVTGLDYSDLIQGKIHVETDGLNLIWKFNKVSATNESWTRWWDTEATDGNQYVEKGYRHYDMQLDGGPVIDVYILHMDAGDTNATWSRESQWRQLSEAINSSDHSRAKLIIGDTNSRYTREDVISNFINRLSTDFTMGDVWVDFHRDGVYPTTAMNNLTDQSDPTNYSNYEIVDKIIYINPRAANTVRLIPQTFRIEQDYTYGNIDGTDDTTPLGDHRPVVATFKYILSGDASPLAVTLQDNADNRSAIASVTSALANVTLAGRTLYKDNSWNTLCLPFNMTAEQVTEQLAPKSLMELDTEGIYDGKQTGFNASTGELYLYFKTATSIEAGKPYIVKWDNGSNIVNPQFHYVTISSTAPHFISFNGGKFCGIYSPTDIYSSDHDKYYLGTDNQLNYPDAEGMTSFTVNAFRAYFDLSDNKGAKIRGFVLNFGQDDADDIKAITPSQKGDADGWYTLSGLLLTEKPVQRGIYISKGKKIFVK